MTADARQQRQFRIEAAATITWLLMDFFWMLEFAAPATALGVASLALWIWTLEFPKDRAEKAATAAMVQWVLMNLIWMLSDQSGYTDLRQWAVVTFALSVLMVFYALSLNRWNFSIARFLRRFRLRR
jgi:hypothetical protein